MNKQFVVCSCRDCNCKEFEMLRDIIEDAYFTNCKNCGLKVRIKMFKEVISNEKVDNN